MARLDDETGRDKKSKQQRMVPRIREQQHNQPIECSSNKMLNQRLHYLHNNPVEAGFVDHPECWKYCSAGDYTGRKGLLEVSLIE